MKTIKCDSIVVTPDNGGWDITVYDYDGEKIKSAWSETCQHAISKSIIFQDFYRNHRIILTHEYDECGKLYESNKVIREQYLPS